MTDLYLLNKGTYCNGRKREGANKSYHYEIKSEQTSILTLKCAEILFDWFGLTAWKSVLTCDID